MTDTEPCHGCGRTTPLDLLDAKDDGSGDFSILHCKACYGPGWLPMASEPVAHRLTMICRKLASQFNSARTGITTT
ncbi:MAG: hypothetical protein KG075_18475 [Alphaproteobacteria bacterium]|nr:hypothetical protein [Alphaproteobacteria bacterium]